MKTLKIKTKQQFDQLVNDLKIENHEQLWERMKKIASFCGQVNVSLYDDDNDGTHHAGFVEPLAIGSSAKIVINYQ